MHIVSYLIINLVDNYKQWPTTLCMLLISVFIFIDPADIKNYTSGL